MSNEHWQQGLFPYQKTIIDTRHEKFRHYLAARQIGMTHTIVREMPLVYAETGRPQVYISANLRQARHVHHQMRLAPVNPLRLDESFFPITPSSRANVSDLVGLADVYVDGYGWIDQRYFDDLKKLGERLAGENGRMIWINTGDVPRENVPARSFLAANQVTRVISLMDAIADGFDFMDEASLRQEYADREEFRALFLC